VIDETDRTVEGARDSAPTRGAGAGAPRHAWTGVARRFARGGL